MKLGSIAAAAALAALAMPALAQQEQDQQQQDPIQSGVDAWQRGDYRGAVAKWRGPAVAGDPDAQFNLGQAYKLGRGVPADLSIAEEWYRKAAVQGHPQAQDNYGLALFQNNKRNEAVEWLQKSSTRGEPRAQFVLGTMYFNGDAVRKDWVRAYGLMTRASQSGLPQASAALAQMDRYISLGDRQQGLVLARQYADEAARTPLPPTLAAAPPPTAPAPGRSTIRTVDVPPSTSAAPPPRPTPVATAPAPRPAVRDGGWRVQLGAFGDPANARKLWGQVGGRFPGRQPYYVKAGTLTKLLVGPYATRGEASGACGSVSPCIPVAP